MEAKQTLHYEETTGAMNEIAESGSGGARTFKATFGLEGEMLSEHYPNNMTATYSDNSIGEDVSLKYEKNNHCSGSECEWFTDGLTPSIHGEAISQHSSLVTDQYRYEQPGQLVETQETPASEDCTAQIYAYNEEGRRTSLTTRKSTSSECNVSEGGEVQRHTYDEANRLTDEGIEYGALGNIAKLPAADAGGHTLETTYYADGQVYSQSQNETTNTYQLDPEDRTSITETSTKGIPTTTISHYATPGGATPSWTENRTAGTWTRNITGFGGLVAVEESGKQAILQLRDLQGNIIGTASLSETAGKPLTLERTTTFGVPISEKPQDKYGWLGTEGLTSNLSSGIIVHDGITYVPQLDVPIQAEGTPVPAPALTVAPYVITVTAPEAFKGEEALAKAEGAGGPSGDLPTPEGENFGMAGGCSGDGACASGNTECQGFALLTELEHGEQTAIAVGGKTICSKKVEVIKVEVCLYEWQSGNGKGPDGFSKLKCGANKRFNESQVPVEVYDSSCKTGGTYLGWVWTYARSGSWSSYLKEPHLTNTVECTGQFPISPEELLEWLDSASKIGEK